MKKYTLLALHVLLIALIAYVFWTITHKPPKTTEICTSKVVSVHTLPMEESPVMSVLSKNSIVLWQGVQKGLDWIYIQYDDGYGWVRIKDFTECKPPLPAGFYEG